MNWRYFIWMWIILMINIKLIGQNEVTGKIIDFDNGEPLTGAAIYIPELSKGTVADLDGTYELTGLADGIFSVQYSFMGYQTIVLKVDFNKKYVVQDIKMQISAIETEEVVITSSSYSAQHENAVKIESVNARQLSKTGSPNLMQALTQIPGVEVISKGNGIAKPVIRGLSNSNLVLLNNGVKMENYQFSENHPFVVNAFGLDNVEVIKGPASLLYGSDAVGGIIHLIPEKPASAGRVEGDVNMSYFSNTQGLSGDFGVKGSGKSLLWGLRAGMTSHMDYSDGKGNTVYNSRFNDQSLKLTTGISKAFGSFRLFYDYNKMKPGLITPGSQLLVTSNERKNRFWYQYLDNHMLVSKNKLFIGRSKIGVNLAWQHNDRKLFTDVENEVNMALDVFSYDVKTWLPSKENTEYIVGIQGANKQNRNKDGHTMVLPDFSQNDFALMAWMKHKHKNDIHVQAGLRWEYRSIFIPEQERPDGDHEHKIGDNTAGIVEALDRQYANLSFSLGATWRITSDFLFRINVASAYRTPNVAELTQDGVHGARYELGNRDLESQRSYEGDLSIHYHSRYVEMDVAGFYNHINQYIFLAPTDSYQDNLQIYQYTQADANLYGLEIYFGILPMTWLNLNGTLSFLRGKQGKDSYLPFIPQDKLKLEAKFQKEKWYFMKQAFMAIGTTLAFEQNRPSDFETTTGFYSLLDFRLGFSSEVGKQKIHFALVGTNLLNEYYVDHLSTLKEMGLYNMGRNITLQLRFPFGVSLPKT